jgi:hypothetical protein
VRKQRDGRINVTARHRGGSEILRVKRAVRRAPSSGEVRGDRGPDVDRQVREEQRRGREAVRLVAQRDGEQLRAHEFGAVVAAGDAGGAGAAVRGCVLAARGRHAALRTAQSTSHTRSNHAASEAVSEVISTPAIAP